MKYHEEYLSRTDVYPPIIGDQTYMYLNDLFDFEISHSKEPDTDIYHYLALRLLDYNVVFKYLISRVESCAAGRHLGYVSYFTDAYQYANKRTDIGLLLKIFNKMISFKNANENIIDGPINAVLAGFSICGHKDLVNILVKSRFKKHDFTCEATWESYKYTMEKISLLASAPSKIVKVIS